jgi:Tol biopolymer transport system component
MCLSLLLTLLCARSWAVEPDRAAIFTMKPDGSEVRLFVALPGKIWNGSPSYSPNGKRVAFDASMQVKGGSASHVFVTRVDNPLEMADDLGLGNCPTWSPDGTKLIFDVQRGNPANAKVGIWIMNADGTDRRWFCAGERGRWSPDGTRVAVSARDDAPSLYIVTPRFRKRILSEEFDHIIGATWSPDGNQLVFIGQHDDQGVLAMISAKGEEGSYRKRWEGRIGWHPSWSPDGKQILLWVKDESGASRLNLIDVAGSDGPQEIPGQRVCSYNSDATWSPDGTRIIFASNRQPEEASQ